MWRRNLLFIAACLAGLGFVASQLLDAQRIQDPQGFQPLRTENSDYSVVRKVNEEFQADWKRKDLVPAGKANELEMIRRISLGLTGVIPSLEEIRAIEKIPSGQRVEWWVSRLLEDRRYADYVAERLARSYVGTENGPFLVFRRRRFVLWLSDRLHKGEVQYDKLVRELIADEGLWTDKPAVNFITVTLDQNDDSQPDPIRLAARTSRAFLGMRIDCLQCHDDRLGNVNLGTQEKSRPGTQQDFHRLAAFFASTQSSFRGVREKGKKPYMVQFLDEVEEEPVKPAPPFLEELLEKNGTLRQQLARWVTHQNNQAFARASVNRMWAILCGQPLLKPIDDIPLYGKYPPGLQTLADDFVEHGYNLERLIRVITATEAFQQASRSGHEITPAHERAWAAFPLTRLRPEQVAGSLIQATTLTTIDANAGIIAQLQKFGQTNDFIQRYGDTGEDEFEDRGGTIPQRLLMMNGNLLEERVSEQVASAAGRIASLAPDDSIAVETAYLCILSRPPTEKERELFAADLAQAPQGQRKQHVVDMFWVLLNGTEFSWNH